MSVLNAIPQFECLTGTLLPVAIPHVANQDLKPEVYDALAVGFERAIDAYLHSGRYHSRAAALHNWSKTPSNLRGLLHAVRGRRPLPDRFVYKEPFLSFAPGYVLDALPDARIIHIVRDGRDCANSLVRTYDVLTDEKLKHLRGSEMRLGRKVDDRYVPWWVDEGHDATFLESSPYVRAIWMWKAMVRRCYERFSQPDVQESGQVMVLKYEDLVRAPQQHGAAILDHLGGSPTRAFKRRLGDARTGSVGKHQKRTNEEIQAAEKIAGAELALYGYDTAFSAEASSC
jgi:hypothetical protein